MSNSASDAEDTEPASDQEHITRFFEESVPIALSEVTLHVRPTQSDCNEFASTLLRCQDIKPVEIQGSFSYTVFSLECQKIVQFRLKRLDEATVSLAHQSYGALVPPANLIEGFSLLVYISPLARGHLHTFEPYPETITSLEKRMRTVQDLARFVAKGALTPQPIDSYKPNSWTLTAKSTLLMIIENEHLAKIEPGFASRAEFLLARIDLLMKLPAALCHVDFFENNIMVDPATGSVTAVLDWDGAQLEAIGMMIYGIYDNFFGSMNGHSSDAKWCSFGTPLPGTDGVVRSARKILESKFWNAFWEAVPSSLSKTEYEDAIRVALEVGLVQRYLSEYLIEGCKDAPEELMKTISLLRGVWLSS